MSIEDRNLKPGTVLVGRHKKREHRCEVVAGEGGKVAYRVGGRDYASPSAAGSAVMGGVSCNGWRFWSVEGTEPATKAARTRTSAKKAPAKAKAAAKPKGRARRSAKAKPALKVAGGSNGEEAEGSGGR